MADPEELRLVDSGGGCWRLKGPSSADFGLVNEYLSYLADRNYSPQTVRVYGYSLLALCRWLVSEDIDLDDVTTDVLLRYLAACRSASVPRRPGPNVIGLDGRRLDGYAPATVNHRLAAISSMFAFRSMRDPNTTNPVPRGREARRPSAGERGGMLSHVARRRQRRSPLRLREPQRLPQNLDPGEVAALLDSLRTWRDRAIAGLMLFCGLRSGEVLSLDVADLDIGARWLRVVGKGAKERRVPLDVDVAGVVQTYLLVERPDTTTTRLFVVAKGPTRGQPLSAAGLRTIFRYHRALSGVPHGHPHALRHTFGTALAEAGVDLAVMQALLGHYAGDPVKSRTHVRSEMDCGAVAGVHRWAGWLCSQRPRRADADGQPVCNWRTRIWSGSRPSGWRKDPRQRLRRGVHSERIRSRGSGGSEA